MCSSVETHIALISGLIRTQCKITEVRAQGSEARYSSSKTHRNDVNERGFSGGLKSDQRQLHLLLPEEGPEPVQESVDEGQHVGDDTADAAAALDVQLSNVVKCPHTHTHTEEVAGAAVSCHVIS